MYLLNGERRHQLEISDRGLQYGDGLFETIEVVDRIPLFLDLHLQRLLEGCERLLIPCADSSLLRREALRIIADSSLQNAVLKLIVTRGQGGRGYRLPNPVNPTRILSLHPYPQFPEHYYQQGVTVRLCRYRLPCNPVLAGIKHLNRLDQIMARSEWQDPGIQEGLLLNHNDFVVEGTMSNVFAITDGELVTPLLDQCGVKGIMRDIVIRLADQMQIPVRQMRCTVRQLQQADALFLTNSIIGIWPVKLFEQRHYSSHSISVQLQQALQKLVTQEISHV